MSDEGQIGKRIRVVLGLAMPVLLIVYLLVMASIDAIRHDDWGSVGAAVALAALLLGPFLLYYFLFRTTEFTIVVGVLLVGLAVYTGFDLLASMERGSSTAGLALLLLLPLIGYPLVLVGAFLDRLSR